MQRGKDIAVRFPGLFLVHHNLPGNVAAPHAHAEHHLLIPLQGEIHVDLAERTLTCGPGRMIYVAPSTEHAFRSARDTGERLVALIEPAAWRRAEGFAAEPAVLPASQLCKELLFHLLLHPKTKHASALVDVFCRTLAETLVAPPPSSTSLAALADAPQTRPELRKALALARDHCTEELSVAALARRAGLSVRSLSRLFQVELGTSPKHLLMALRVEKARELLLAGDRSVTEVAFAVGYGSLSPFIAAFRQFTGQLPSEVAAAGRAGRNPQELGRGR